MTTPEGRVQKYCMERLKAKGCLVRKINYEMRRGCPDLLVLVPKVKWGDTPRRRAAGNAYLWLKPRTLFLEIKKDEQTKPDPHQQREHERIRQHGGDVRVIGSREQVDSLLSELFPCD